MQPIAAAPTPRTHTHTLTRRKAVNKRGLNAQLTDIRLTELAICAMYVQQSYILAV